MAYRASVQISRRRMMAVGVAATALARPAIVRAAGDSIRFSCDFRIYGGTAPFFYGLDRGFFSDVGIDAHVDGSAGSADAVTRVASGAYDFGCADSSTVLIFANNHPDAAPVLLMPIYDRCAAAVISPKTRHIDSFKALVGHKLGTGQADAGSRILPALLRKQGIDPASIHIVETDIQLRDSLLLQGRVDAVIGFDYTVLFNLLGNGMKPEESNVVYFADNGFNFYGQGLIANPDVLKRNPDLARRVAVAVVRSWLAAAQNPEAAIESMVKREPLSDRTIELARLNWVLEKLILTPNVRKNGLGTMDPTRLREGIAVLAEGFQMPHPPTDDQIFDGRFVPPLASRQVG